MHATRSRSSLSRAAACISLLGTAAGVHAQPLELYVDDDAPGGGDGLSWGTAFRSLTDALDLVRSRVESGLGGHSDIRVAQGVYVPGNGSLDRTSTFSLLSGTTISGGYAGVGASDPDERDPLAFVSVLSGDLQGDDLPGFVNRSDNAYHVITFDDGGNFAGAYGFLVRGGHADGEFPHSIGGGFTATQRSRLGTVGSCWVTDNFAASGGGIGVTSGAIIVHRSTVTGNHASLRGGGAWLAGGGHVQESRFVGNRAGVFGGGVACEGPLATLNLSEFNGNTASFGGALSIESGGVHVYNSTIASNIAASGSGLAIRAGGTATVVNSVIAFNGDTPNDQIASVASGAVILGHSLVRGGLAPESLASGAAFSFMYIDSDPRFVSLRGLDGVAGTIDDDLRPTSSSLAIDAGLAAEPWYHESSLPWAIDLAGAPRFHDDPGMLNIGSGWRTDVDIGAYEFQGTSCRADHDGDTAITVPDIFSYLSDWFAQRLEADFDRDRSIEVDDLFHYLSAWFAGC